ncbi:MAG: response regulator [Planctomycetales bacterium]|nr:response regulator [Planctomycetales bacterium]
MCNSQPTRLNVLVAEDGLLNQRFAVRLLEGAGHTVTLVCNGAEALEALRHNDFDLVLMDVEMPEMDGIAAAQAIRADEEEGTRIPIVAVTATGDRETCLRAGMDDWLPKPLSLARLNRTIERLAEKKRISWPIPFAELANLPHMHCLHRPV